MTAPLIDDPIVQVAELVSRTEAEGPGWRFALWVQGCPFRCSGCCNPEMLSFTPARPARAMRASDLAAQALASDTEGVTFLGGEPFAQAAALAHVARAVREAGRTVMIFSGYTRDELERSTDAGVRALFEGADLLVDGRYDAAQRSTARRWIGSDNQVMHFLTERYSRIDPRFYEGNHLEIRVRNGEITLNGWPVHGARTRLGVLP